jgi:hypothetical protein
MVVLPCIHKKKKGHLLLIERGNISVKGDPKEKISQVTILLIKKKSILVLNNIRKTKITGICRKYT